MRKLLVIGGEGNMAGMSADTSPDDMLGLIKALKDNPAHDFILFHFTDRFFMPPEDPEAIIPLFADKPVSRQYWNQQALSLRAIGYHLMNTPAAEGLFGKQPEAGKQIADMVEKAFVSRVLQPATAQLKIEALTRDAVTVYLDALNEGLKAVQADYNISEQDWSRYVEGLAGTILAVEGNRQVPLLLKGATVVSGAIAVKIGQTVAEQVRGMIFRAGRREMYEEGAMYAGRYVARGFGGIAFVAMTGWDIYDHHRTVSQNTPVMRRLLSEYFDQLESLVLNDSQCGILQTLDRVRRMVAEQYKGP